MYADISLSYKSFLLCSDSAYVVLQKLQLIHLLAQQEMTRKSRNWWRRPKVRILPSRAFAVWVVTNRNLIAITKELEKQVLIFADTNSSILRHMEALEASDEKRGTPVDIWGKASRFYFSVGNVKDQLYPEVVGLFHESLRADWKYTNHSCWYRQSDRSTAYATDSGVWIQPKEGINHGCSLFVKYQIQDEELLSQLKSREQIISAYQNDHKEMLEQTQKQISDVRFYSLFLLCSWAIRSQRRRRTSKKSAPRSSVLCKSSSRTTSSSFRIL